MTTPTEIQEVALPVPTYPMIVMLVTDDIVGVNQNGSALLRWMVGGAHPFIPDMTAVRMFVDRGGVEVYSAHSDGKTFMRDLVPMDRVRLVQEAMPLDIFVEELEAAEDSEPEYEPENGPEQQPTNGQTALS